MVNEFFSLSAADILSLEIRAMQRMSGVSILEGFTGSLGSKLNSSNTHIGDLESPLSLRTSKSEAPAVELESSKHRPGLGENCVSLMQEKIKSKGFSLARYKRHVLLPFCIKWLQSPSFPSSLYQSRIYVVICLASSGCRRILGEVFSIRQECARTVEDVFLEHHGLLTPLSARAYPLSGVPNTLTAARKRPEKHLPWSTASHLWLYSLLPSFFPVSSIVSYLLVGEEVAAYRSRLTCVVASELESLELDSR